MTGTGSLSTRRDFRGRHLLESAGVERARDAWRGVAQRALSGPDRVDAVPPICVSRRSAPRALPARGAEARRQGAGIQTPEYGQPPRCHSAGVARPRSRALQRRGHGSGLSPASRRRRQGDDEDGAQG